VKIQKIKPAGLLAKPWWTIVGLTLVVVVWCSIAFADTRSVNEETLSATKAKDTEQANSAQKLINNTGIYNFYLGFQELFTGEEVSSEAPGAAKKENKGILPTGVGQIIMIIVGLLLIYLGVAKEFEPSCSYRLDLAVCWPIFQSLTSPALMVSWESSTIWVSRTGYFRC